MPSSLQTLDTAFPKIDDQQTTEENLNQVVNYLYMLLENLRYTLGNLGEDNFNDTELESLAKLIREPIWARIEDNEGNIHTLNVTAQNLLSQISDLDGNISTLQQTAETLSSRITTADGNISTLTQTANSLSSKISDAEGNISSLTQTVNGLGSKISSAEGNISTLQQTANSLSTKVSNAEGNISTLQQTANSLSSKISTAEGNISTLTQTANSLSSKISTAEGNISSLQQTAETLSSRITTADGNISSLTQTVNGFSLSVSNGTSSSTIKLMSGSTLISSQNISFSGMVTFSDLSAKGSTTINGGNITTGEIDAVDVRGVKVYGSRFYNSGGTTWMEVGKDLFGADNDAYAMYIASSSYSGTEVFGIHNGDFGLVTLNGKGFNFLSSDAETNTVRINVGTNGKYWEFSTNGIKFCNADGTVTNRVQLVN